MASEDRTTAGVVYVEFLLAFLPVFLLFLGITQLAFVSAAKLVVQHAAAMAARSAIVVLPDDPRHYGGEPVGFIDPSASSPASPDWQGRFKRTAGLRGSAGAPAGFPQGKKRGGARLSAIRRAAYVPLATMAPAPEQITAWLSLGGRLGPGQSVKSAVGASPLARTLFGLFAYNTAAAAVTFPRSPGSHDFHERSVGTEEVTVRVTFLFHCAVPVVSRLMCDTVGTLSGRKKFSKKKRRRRAPKDARERLAAELEHVESPKALTLLVHSRARFVALSAEATLPVQNAAYTQRTRENG